MAGYIIVDVKTRKIIIISAVVAVVLFVIGIIIGYFSGAGSKSTTVSTSRPNVADAIRSTCGDTTIRTPSGKLFLDRYVQRHSEKNVCLKNPEDCLDFGLPRNYIAYHLHNKSIKIDGKLDDDAWNEVKSFSLTVSKVA